MIWDLVPLIVLVCIMLVYVMSTHVVPADACGRLDRSLFGNLGEGEEWKKLDFERFDANTQ